MAGSRILPQGLVPDELTERNCDFRKLACDLAICSHELNSLRMRQRDKFTIVGCAGRPFYELQHHIRRNGKLVAFKSYLGPSDDVVGGRDRDRLLSDRESNDVEKL